MDNQHESLSQNNLLEKSFLIKTEPPKEYEKTMLEQFGKFIIPRENKRRIRRYGEGKESIKFTVSNNRYEGNHSVRVRPYIYYWGKFVHDLAHENYPVAWHGTRLSRLKGILESGKMIPFYEGESSTSHIYTVSNPIDAAYHADINGPEDTNVLKSGGKRGPDKNDPIVVLAFDLRNPILQQKINDTLSHNPQRFKRWNLHKVLELHTPTKQITIPELEFDANGWEMFDGPVDIKDGVYILDVQKRRKNEFEMGLKKLSEYKIAENK